LDVLGSGRGERLAGLLFIRTDLLGYLVVRPRQKKKLREIAAGIVRKALPAGERGSAAGSLLSSHRPKAILGTACIRQGKIRERDLRLLASKLDRSPQKKQKAVVTPAPPQKTEKNLVLEEAGSYGNLQGGRLGRDRVSKSPGVLERGVRAGAEYSTTKGLSSCGYNFAVGRVRMLEALQ
jgi:hypothetical protein